MLGLGEKSPKKRASQSRPVLGYSAGFIQPPCSRQRMCILVSASDQATAAPDAPAPMIRTSTGSFIPGIFPTRRHRFAGDRRAKDRGRSGLQSKGAPLAGEHARNPLTHSYRICPEAADGIVSANSEMSGE